MTAKFNLAPEVYQTSQRNKRRRQVATSIAAIVNVVAVGLVILCLVLLGGQKIAIAALQGQINSRQNQVKTFADLPDAVTAQQDLTAINQLNSSQVYLSRFFSVLQSVAPLGIQVSSVKVGQDNTLQITGSALNYITVTQFSKALQAYNVTVGPNASASQQPYFNNVELGGVSGNTTGGVNFNVTTQMSSQVTTSGH